MKCKLCEYTCSTDIEMYTHLNSVHREVLLKEGMTAQQYWYHHINRHKLDNIGVCICGEPKPWSPDQNRYAHYCMQPEHKAKLRQDYENNMYEKYATINPAELPEHQEKMMRNRKIAKTFVWGKKKFFVLSDVEYQILHTIKKMGYRVEDVEAPAMGVNIKYTIPGDNKQRNHIPDIFIKSINLIVSGKDGMDNPNRSPHFKKDRLKSIYEYKTILETTNYNFLQVEGKEGLKDLEKHIREVEKFHRKGARYVLPPRVDFHMIMEGSIADDDFYDPSVVDNSFQLDVIDVYPHGYALASSNNEKVSFLLEYENGEFILSARPRIKDRIEVNYNALCESYSDSNIRTLNILDDPKIIKECIIEVSKMTLDIIQEFIL